jgi:predicted Asp-tRNA(Asn)/Glu-tRNA(Gln) amidotransferase subunit C
MPEQDDIKKEAQEVLEGLSKALGEIDLEETYYVVEDINVTRKDGTPELDEDFKTITKKNAVKLDRDGNFIMEVGKWVE